MNISLLFLQNGYCQLNLTPRTESNKKISKQMLATLLSNMAYYGYCPNKELYEYLESCTEQDAYALWRDLEPALIEEKATDRNMNDHVVYKNFPDEVISMDRAEYWTNQILMYLGFDSLVKKENKKSRSKSLEIKNLKLIAPATKDTLSKIYNSLVNLSSSWSEKQKEQAFFAFKYMSLNKIDFDDFSFKLNAISLLSDNYLSDIEVIIKDATNVAKFALYLSGDESGRLSSKSRFKNFSRKERRMLLSALENTKNLEDDAALSKSAWKSFLYFLHPNDYNFKRVIALQNSLYNNNLKSFQGKVDAILKESFPDYFVEKVKRTTSGSSIADSIDSNTLSILMSLDLPSQEGFEKKATLSQDEAYEKIIALFKTRPGEFLRQYHFLYDFFGSKVAAQLSTVLYKIEPIKLVKFKKYIQTINTRKSLIYSPNGSWTKANFELNTKTKLSKESINLLVNEINLILNSYLEESLPEGVSLDEDSKLIKLQTNNQELAPYGRGTKFKIPENITFIRTGSYWQTGEKGNIWYDNGFNLFDENWMPKATCSWEYTNEAVMGGAYFSGDPTTSSSDEGKACQMIDLYIDTLSEKGVRYALWNILAFSKSSFTEAEVIATLQMGENPLEDDIYEPSRAEFVFPLKGDNLTKYILLIDLKEREIIYLDANLYADVHGASLNEDRMSDRMPDFLEYLNSLPSVYDVFESFKSGPIPIVYSDKDITFDSQKAYVFDRKNLDLKYDQIDLNSILK